MSAITWFPVVGCKFSMSHFQFWQILLTFNCRSTVMKHQTSTLVVSATFHLIDLWGGGPILANTSHFRLHRIRTLSVMSHQTLILVMSLTFHLIDLGGGGPILANTSHFRLHRLRTFSVLSHRTLASALSAKFCFSKSGLCQNMRDGFNMKFIDMWG